MGYSQRKSSLRLPSNLAAALAYLLGWLSGIIVLLLEREDAYVRFHAAQSILVFGALTVIGFILPIISGIMGVIPVLGLIVQALLTILSLLVGLAAVIAWIILILFAILGRDYRVPYVDTYAEQLATRAA